MVSNGYSDGTGDPGRAHFLQEELGRIEERIKRDWGAAAYFRDQLKMAPLPSIEAILHGDDGGGDGGGPGVPAGQTVTGAPADHVNPGQFGGLTSTHASRAVLEMVGRTRPLKIDEIFDAIRVGGVQISSAQALYRSLDRSPEFHKPVRGRWGLSEWYPASARKKARQQAPDEAEPAAESEPAVDHGSDAPIVENVEPEVNSNSDVA